LQDDYVKFIRYAQWRITSTGVGTIGYISNHSFLDNPTFKGMRASLIQDLPLLYFLDLHGNTKKGETSPDNSKDENVFDIQQGVAISFKHLSKNNAMFWFSFRVHAFSVFPPRFAGGRQTKV